MVDPGLEVDCEVGDEYSVTVPRSVRPAETEAKVSACADGEVLEVGRFDVVVGSPDDRDTGKNSAIVEGKASLGATQMAEGRARITLCAVTH